MIGHPNEQLEAELLPVLVKLFPRAFFARGKSCRPLRVGIFDDLDAALPPEIDRAKLRRYLNYYTTGSRYLREVQSGVVRVDLHGMPAGYVSEAEAAHAKERWDRIYAAVKAVFDGPKPETSAEKVVQALMATSEPPPIPQEIPAAEPAPAQALTEPRNPHTANLAELLARKKAAQAKQREALNGIRGIRR
jgi:ProP effector